jgi:hypothetical protein
MTQTTIKAQFMEHSHLDVHVSAADASVVVHLLVPATQPSRAAGHAGYRTFSSFHHPGLSRARLVVQAGYVAAHGYYSAAAPVGLMMTLALLTIRSGRPTPPPSLPR